MSKRPNARVALCVAWLASIFAISLTAPAARAQVRTETIEVDTSAATHPFPHYWERMFGSGRAILSLRDSYRRTCAR